MFSIWMKMLTLAGNWFWYYFVCYFALCNIIPNIHTLCCVLVLRAHGHRTHPQFAFSEFINQEATHSSKHTHISIVIVIVLCCVVPTAEWRWRRSHTAGKTDVCIIRRSVSSARIRNTIFCAAGRAVPLGQSSLKIPFTINSPQLHQNVLL